MIIAKHIVAIDSHTAGEPTRIVVSGIGKVPGASIADKRQYLQEHMDHYRTMLMHEPRGHRDMFGAILFEPIDPAADFGIVFMDGGYYLNMCGHGTIGAVTTIVEMGYVPVREPVTNVVLETSAGLVYGTAHVEGGKVLEVTVRNVDAFLYKKDITITVPGYGALSVDISFGGSFFALADITDTGIDISPSNSQKLIDLGVEIRRLVNESVEVQHPVQTHINSVDLTEMYSKPKTEGANAQNVVILGEGQVDRSPCGTGTCAKMATLFGKGKLALGEEYVNESIIRTSFSGRLIRETMVGDIPAVIPEVTGRAYITGVSQFVCDPEDPFKYGFAV
jgi:proline racemase